MAQLNCPPQTQEQPGALTCHKVLLICLLNDTDHIHALSAMNGMEIRPLLHKGTLIGRE